MSQLEKLTEAMPHWGRLMSVREQRTTWALTEPGELVSYTPWSGATGTPYPTQLGIVVASIFTFTQAGHEVWVLWNDP